MSVKMFSPTGMLPNTPYHHVAVATGTRQVHVAGQVAHTRDDSSIPPDLAGQVSQALRNVAHGLAGAGAGFRDVVRLTVYVTDWHPDKIDLGLVTLTAAAFEGDNLTRAVAAHLNFHLTPENRAFTGKRGRTRLVVTTAAATPEYVNELVPHLDDDEKLVLASTSVDPDAQQTLRKACRGSIGLGWDLILRALCARKYSCRPRTGQLTRPGGQLRSISRNRKRRNPMEDEGGLTSHSLCPRRAQQPRRRVHTCTERFVNPRRLNWWTSSVAVGSSASAQWQRPPSLRVVRLRQMPLMPANDAR